MEQLQGVPLEQLQSALQSESSKFSQGTSAYRGVSHEKSRRKYTAFIRIQSKSVRLGSFDTEEDAAHAYDDAARRIRGRYSFAGTALLSVAHALTQPCSPYTIKDTKHVATTNWATKLYVVASSST